MSFTFDMLSIRTVPSSYSWDKGVPGVTFTNLVTSLNACKRFSNNAKGIEYVGYAPFVSIALSSDSGAIDISENIVRTVNFGDYYNSESNIITNSSFDYAVFSHAYLMPGLYSVQIERKQYVTLLTKDVYTYGACFQRHCVNWTWANLNTNYSVIPNVVDFNWRATKQGGTYEKKWRREPCTDEQFSGNGLYVEKIKYNDNKRAPLSWQWFNFRQNPSNNPLNTITPWLSTGFQRPDQLTWKQTSGPCLQNLNYHGTNIIWKWDYVTAQRTGNYITNLTWDEAVANEPGNITWDFSSQFCNGDTANLLLSTGIQTITTEAYIRVLEIPPQAYLEVIQPEDRMSPLTVTLTPRNIISGSFPIEKIVWDLGDGSPLITQRRWAPTLEAPFVYSGSVCDDYEDPRNYDIVYTYRKTPTSPYSFYPSLTAYASSTGTTDSTTAVVGPLRYTESNVVFNLLQSELTDKGKILLGQIDNEIAVWKADK